MDGLRDRVGGIAADANECGARNLHAEQGPGKLGVNYPTFAGAQAVCYADINAQVAGYSVDPLV